MAKRKHHKHTGSRTPANQPPPNQGLKKWIAPAAIVVMLASAAIIFYFGSMRGRQSSKAARSAAGVSAANTGDKNVQPGVTTADMGVTGEPVKMSVAQALVVTVELDFGGRIPTIAEAIQQIKREHTPDDGIGRTFAILDAYGEPTADGKLHMSMHVSGEKAGMGMLKFNRTGEMLWRARIGNPGDPPAAPKSLTIYVSKGTSDGSNYALDGSRGGDGVLNVFLQNSQQRARDVWPDGAEREVTFIYSACGCPVKVMCRRVGERTVRTKDTPVIFPDDPDAVRTISNLMKW